MDTETKSQDQEESHIRRVKSYKTPAQFVVYGELRNAILRRMDEEAAINRESHSRLKLSPVIISWTISKE